MEMGLPSEKREKALYLEIMVSLFEWEFVILEMFKFSVMIIFLISRN